MSDELLTQAQAAVRRATKAGAQGARARLTRARESSLEWRDGALDRLRESTRRSLAVALYVDGRYSSSTTSDLRPQALERFIDAAVGMTRLLAPDDARGLPDPARYTPRSGAGLALYDRAGAAVGPDDRRADAATMEATARSCAGADRIVSITCTCEDELNEVAVVASNGLSATEQSSTFAHVCSVSLRGDGDRKQPAWWYSFRRRRGDLLPVKEVAEETMRRGRLALGSAPHATGRYGCVVENATGRQLLGSLLAAADGAAVQQRRSFLQDRVGDTIGSPALQVSDDPLLPGGLASCSFDGEGMATRTRPVFERGVLRQLYLDTYYARKLSLQPTIGSRSNVVLAPGERDLPGLLRAMDRGLFVTTFLGGNSNSATGDFSFGVRGFWVEGGAIVRPVAEMNIAGNHGSFWKRLVETGNDPWLESSYRTPSLRFEDVQFSGA